MRQKLILPILFIVFTNTLCSQNPIDSSKLIKVMSFNILHGATMKGNFDLDVIAKVIINEKPDLVALQEVDFKTRRAKNYDLVTELAWRTKMAALFGRAMYYDEGEYGEGILSNFSFIQSRNIALPYSKGNEPRTALEILVELPSKDTIAFIGTHLDHTKNDKDRISQAKEINAVFSKNIYPTILAGDLNAEPNSKTIMCLEEIWKPTYNKEKYEYTFPSNKPSIKIDYIMFFPKHRWKIHETKVIKDTIASDHCAYIVILELIDSQGK